MTLCFIPWSPVCLQSVPKAVYYVKVTSLRLQWIALGGKHPILYRTWRKNPVGGDESFWWVSSDGARSDRNQEVSAAQHRDGKGSTSTWRSYLFFVFFSVYFLHRKLGRRGVSLSGSGVQRAKSSQLLQPAFTLRMNHSLGSSRHTGTAWWSVGVNFTSGKHDETLFVFFCRGRIRLVLQHVSMQKRSTLFELVHSLSETTNVTKSEIFFFFSCSEVFERKTWIYYPLNIH